MGYSKSRVTLNRRLKEHPEFFEALARGQPARLVDAPDSASHNSYKVHEALYVASLHSQFYPALAAAHGRFSIEILDSRTIQARPKEGPTAGAVASGDATPEQGRESAAPAFAPQTVAGLKTATDIISFCIRRFPTNDSFHFPNAELSEEELGKVWRWCQTLTPKRVIIKPRGTNAISISNKNPSIPKTAIWRPAGTADEGL
jgi:hypothetical protein